VSKRASKQEHGHGARARASKSTSKTKSKSKSTSTSTSTTKSTSTSTSTSEHEQVNTSTSKRSLRCLRALLSDRFFGFSYFLPFVSYFTAVVQVGVEPRLHCLRPRLLPFVNHAAALERCDRSFFSPRALLWRWGLLAGVLAGSRVQRRSIARRSQSLALSAVWSLMCWSRARAILAASVA